ncbi:MAG: hypothetical protein L6W00_12895 [Lentisphaeria bacterium]|nr:MAG: hypothetical protein L6W00_12895 [Lentisphaeria bacterium]
MEKEVGLLYPSHTVALLDDFAREAHIRRDHGAALLHRRLIEEIVVLQFAHLPNRGLLGPLRADRGGGDRLAGAENRLPDLVGQNAGVDRRGGVVLHLADHHDRLAPVGPVQRAGGEERVDRFQGGGLPVLDVDPVGAGQRLVAGGVDAVRCDRTAASEQQRGGRRASVEYKCLHRLIFLSVNRFSL